MDTFLGRYRNLIVLAAILFAQIVGLAVQVRRPAKQGETRLIRLWAISAVTPIEKGVVHAQNWVHYLFFNYAYLRGVRRENRQLRAEIERMRLDEIRLAEDARMARRVQTLLAFKEQYVNSTVAAQVIGTSGSDQSRVLYIDKGSNDGIRTDMAVITPNGIVGKIVQVFPDSAQVLPINDQLSGVGVVLQDSRLQGILRGAPTGTTTVQYIMSDEKVVPGDQLITSGGDRIFPKGLPVGKVVSVEPGKDLFLNIRVVPAAKLDQLEEVLVITKIVEKQPDTKDLEPIRASDILAQRLPTIPNKPDAAAANVKPGEAPAGTAAGSTPASAATGTGTHPVLPGVPGGKSSVAATAGSAKPNALAPVGHGVAASGGAAAATAGTVRAAPATGSPGVKPANNGETAIPSRPARNIRSTNAPANGDASQGAVSAGAGNGDTTTPKAKPKDASKPEPDSTPGAGQPASSGTPQPANPNPAQPNGPPGEQAPQL